MVRFNEDLTNLPEPDALNEAKRRIRRELGKLKVLQELSDSAQEKVADQVFTATRMYQRFRTWLQPSQERPAFSSRGLRRLATRFKRLRRAFDDVADECDRLDPTGDLGDWIGRDHVTEVLDEFESRADIAWDMSDGSSKPTMKLQDVRRSCSLQLLLTLEIHGIKRGPASARVAKIENAFWDGNIRETDEDTNRKRSSAILKRLSRGSSTH